MSDYADGVVCEKCGSGNLKAVAPMRLHFRVHVHCEDCGHEEHEVLAFMRWHSTEDKR